MKKLVKKLLKPVKWHNMRATQPISKVFGLDRGTPIDRYYIDQFLNKNRTLIRGSVLEIAESVYTKKYATDLSQVKSEILHYTSDNPEATIIGDLTDKATLPGDRIDCFICTQTLNFIYNFKDAIHGAHFLLKENGVILVTLAGISQISRYDMDRWGDFWRFTSKSAQMAFEEVFGEGNVEVESFGNVMASISFLHGISVEELTKEELDFNDPNYQITITVVARKRQR